MTQALVCRWPLVHLGLVMCVWLGGATAHAAPVGSTASPRTFERDVRPILKAHCFHCHGEGTELKGELDVRLKRFLEKGGESGAALVPGKPDDSRLLRLIKSGKMPKGEKKLKPEEIQVLEQWIAQGAPTLRPEPEKIGPESLITPEDRAWWAFQPIKSPAVPAVKAAGRVATPIDAFVLARLEDKGLTLSPEADRRTLIRRAYFDLIGLPPTPQEVDAFVADTSAGAYEKLIDKLLASPHYGERWGRHWLDVAGYSDSEGYNDDDTPRDDAWRYRDYVIRAFNNDKPWDRFITEQLAGDELVKQPHTNLSPEAIEKLTATGYLRMAPDGTGTRNDDQELARQTVVTETVKIVSTSLLGMTVGCAECHDHRYDPILQRDFYRLRAIFEPALNPKSWKDPRRRQLSLLTDEQRKAGAVFEAEARKVEAKLQVKYDELRDWVFEQEVAALPEDIREAARQAGLAWRKDAKGITPEQKKLVDENPGVKVAANAGVLNLFLNKYGREKELADFIAAVTAEAASIRARKAPEEFLRALTEPVYDAKKSVPPATFIFARGNYKTPADAVGPGDLFVIAPDAVNFPLDDASVATTGRRLAFARHLTSGKHPLLARVLVNRFWSHHFGRGIVASLADFGHQGDAPSHPELLDYLAGEFMARGWSLKKLHKLVMTSSVYRQSSARHAEGDRIDAANALYWRMPVRRLEAEALRDAVLAVSGKLNTQPFGSPVPVIADENSQIVVGSEKPSPDGQEYRRSIYVTQRRTTPANVLAAFDAPTVMEPNCELRNCSTVAPQSLLLMNSQFVVEQAEAFANRVEREAGTDPARQVEHAWLLAFGSRPTPRDTADMTAYLNAQTPVIAPRIKREKGDKDGSLTKARVRTLTLASVCQVLLGSNPFLYVD